MSGSTTRFARGSVPAVLAAFVAGFLLISGWTGPPGPAHASQHNQDGETTEWEGLMLPPGVEGEVLLDNLSFPTGIEWDDEDRMYVSLVGFTEEGRQILRGGDNGTTEPLDLQGADLTPQILDLTFHEGSIYFTTTGKIHVHDLDTGQTETIATGLPAWGDHRTDEIVFGPDGRLYVGQGTVTNSGVVGLDEAGAPNNINNVTGERPNYRDIPCREITLSGANWETTNPFVDTTDLNADEGAGRDARVVFFQSEQDVQDYVNDTRDGETETPDDGEQDQQQDTRAQDQPGEEDQGPADPVDPNREDLWLTWQDTGQDRVITGPFSPFATATYQGQTIPGDPRCNGSVISMEPDGSDLRPVAWGFRNPFALKFDDQDRLWVADNGPDKRGSRPLGPGPDTIQFFDVPEDGDSIPWYGWPDHTMGIPYDDPFFAPPWGPDVALVFEEPPSEPLVQFTFSGAHASSNKFDFGPPNSTYENSLFIAEFGNLGTSYHLGALAGMQVARVDRETGRFTEFIAGADRWSGTFRPVEAAFGPDDRLYVVEFGAATQEPGSGNATHGETYNQTFHPETGRVLAFTLPDEMDWEGRPMGNPGGDGQNLTEGEVSPSEPDDDAVVEVFDYGFLGDDDYFVGEPIAFQNTGEEGHTATDEERAFNSGFELAPDTTYTWTPDEAGTYAFYCAVHPGMRGTIEVQEEQEEEPTDEGEPTGEEEEEEEPTPAPGIIAIFAVFLGVLWWVRLRR